MITAALEGKLEEVSYDHHPIFGLAIPRECENVPSEILDPRNTWKDKEAYDKKAKELSASFKTNFRKYEAMANQEILQGGPQV